MNDEPVKVLYFVDRMLRGGIQSLVIDWVSRFDKQKIHVDFLLLDDGNKYELEDKLKELGCNVYKLKGIWIRNPFDYIKYAKAMNNFFKNHHDYKVVHMHSSSKNYMVLKYAKKYGIPIRIAHAHALDFQTNSKIKKIFGNILKPKLKKYSTNFFACSELAGKWLFGKNVIMSNKFEIINNGIDLEKFKYDKLVRKKIRDELNIKEGDILLGHVGRFTKVKNHEFLVDLFYKVHKLDSRYKLILIGTGPLEESIKEKVAKLGINESVFFMGYKENTNEYFQAIDVFLLPSLYEGLGIVLIEAQASGLTCIATKYTIPKLVKINENFYFESLDLECWKKRILNLKLKRIISTKNIKDNGFDIVDVTSKLSNFYINGGI